MGWLKPWRVRSSEEFSFQKLKFQLSLSNASGSQRHRIFVPKTKGSGIIVYNTSGSQRHRVFVSKTKSPAIVVYKLLDINGTNFPLQKGKVQLSLSRCVTLLNLNSTEFSFQKQKVQQTLSNVSGSQWHGDFVIKTRAGHPRHDSC